MKERYLKKSVIKQLKQTPEDFDNGIGPSKKKKKPLDITDEIKQFLSQEITLDTIKRILIRLHGPFPEEMLNKSTIRIVGLPWYNGRFREVNSFVIYITTHKTFYSYYLGCFTFVDLCYFGIKDLENSDLKSTLSHQLRDWLIQNFDKVRIIE